MILLLFTTILDIIVLSYKKFCWLLIRTKTLLGRPKGQTCYYEDSDESSCSEDGLSASTVKRSQKTTRSLGRNRRKTSQSRWKFCTHADKSQMLQDIIQMRPTKEHVLFELASCISSNINADGFTLYIVESDDPEIYMGQSTSENNKMQKVKPQEGSYLLHVAKTKETVRLSKGVPDDRFTDGIPNNSEIGHVLCQAITQPDGHLIAVVELFRREESIPFEEEDEEISSSYLVWGGIALHYFDLFMNYKVAFELLSYHFTSTEEELQQFLTNTSSDIAPNIDDYYFNPFAVDNMQKIRMAAHMFIDLFGLNWFDETSLIRFTLTVKKNYRRVPYHNWSHGFCVANTNYCLMKSSSHVFRPIERLALYVGSLCHDVDHRGKTNQFMLDSESPLAAIYSTSTMEYHHFNHTVTILQQEGHNIFSKLSSSEYKEVLNLIKHCILATDLALYFPNRAKLQNLVEEEKLSWSNPEHRLMIQAIAMTASDLSASTKPWEVQTETVKRIYEEFYEQGDAEREAGRKPITLMDRNKVDEQANSQVGFLKGICIPCYSLLYRVIPESKPLLDMCQKNLERWQQIAQDMKENKQ